MAIDDSSIFYPGFHPSVASRQVCFLSALAYLSFLFSAPLRTSSGFGSGSTQRPAPCLSPLCLTLGFPGFPDLSWRRGELRPTVVFAY